MNEQSWTICDSFLTKLGVSWFRRDFKMLAHCLEHLNLEIWKFVFKCHFAKVVHRMLDTNFLESLEQLLFIIWCYDIANQSACLDRLTNKFFSLYITTSIPAFQLILQLIHFILPWYLPRFSIAELKTWTEVLQLLLTLRCVPLLLYCFHKHNRGVHSVSSWKSMESQIVNQISTKISCNLNWIIYELNHL